jgi:hypothetical protein
MQHLFLMVSSLLAVPALGFTQSAPPVEAKKGHLPEWGIRIIEIGFGDPMKGGTTSPLSVSKSRYNWEWLARRHGIGVRESLAPSRFQGPSQLFDQLDRNGDGVIDASDFEWSPRAPFVQQQASAMSLFNRLNADGDDVISAKEWEALFKRIAGNSRGATAEDLRRELFAPPARPSVNPPTRWSRLFGYFAGELGSFHEGPNPGEAAPDFVLSRQDGLGLIRLSEYRDKKPVVLVFGSFT